MYSDEKIFETLWQKESYACGNGNAPPSLHLSRVLANRGARFNAFGASGFVARYLGSVAIDGDAPARDSKGRHVVHLWLRPHEKHLRSLRTGRLHPNGVFLRALRRGHRIGQ